MKTVLGAFFQAARRLGFFCRKGFFGGFLLDLSSLCAKAGK
jgi:hypothetical protein